MFLSPLDSGIYKLEILTLGINCYSSSSSSQKLLFHVSMELCVAFSWMVVGHPNATVQILHDMAIFELTCCRRTLDFV